MPSVLITGANRGLGLEFARQYAAEGWRVYATCRFPGAATELLAVRGDVKVPELDVTDADQIETLAALFADTPLDLLIANAGIAPRGAGRFGRIDYERWQEALRVNTLGPVRVVEALAPNLERGELKTVVAITSRQGSLAEMGPGVLVYGSSKAALNAAMRTLAAELRGRGIRVVMVNPGWVRTDMGGAAAPLGPEQSVAALRRLIAGLGPADSGRFFDYDGSEIPW